MKSSEAGKFILSIAKSWKSILILFFTGIGLSFGFMYILSQYTQFVAYTTVVILLIGFIGGGLIMAWAPFAD